MWNIETFPYFENILLNNYNDAKYNAKEKQNSSKVFPEPVETLFEARHRRSGAQMPGNKIYTLRREERSLIFDAIYQEIYIGKSHPGNIYQEI